MLCLDSLSLVRGERRLFAGMSVSLPESSLLIVKGANGAGKTSLLGALAGRITPHQGSVSFEGKPVKGNLEFRSRLAFVSAQNGLKECLSVRDNLVFYARANGNPELIPSALRFFEIESRADELVGTLSSGLKRRVAMARLLLGNYSVWLLDEPTNFLDAEGVALLTSLIESRVQQGGIVVIASHTMGSQFPAHMLQLEDFA